MQGNLTKSLEEDMELSTSLHVPWRRDKDDTPVIAEAYESFVLQVPFDLSFGKWVPVKEVSSTQFF